MYAAALKPGNQFSDALVQPRNVQSPTHRANPLCCNILPATPFDARIYGSVLAFIPPNHKKGNMLANVCFKKM
jgi:hypothetical protein